MFLLLGEHTCFQGGRSPELCCGPSPAPCWEGTGGVLSDELCCDALVYVCDADASLTPADRACARLQSYTTAWQRGLDDLEAAFDAYLVEQAAVLPTPRKPRHYKIGGGRKMVGDGVKDNCRCIMTAAYPLLCFSTRLS